jgi:peptide/nickel transport system substrate-binding protein
MMTDAKNRNAVMQAVDVDELVKQTYFGRGEKADQIYPSNMMPPEFGKQSVPHDPSVLTAVAAGLPPDQKSVTIGYDSSNPDNQLISNLLQTQLAAAGLNAKVQAYPTSEIYGWIGSDAQSAPEIMAYLGWPDAPSPYTWGHISWDGDGGLNFFGCSAPPVTAALAKGLPTGSQADYSTAGLEAVKTGCWLNIANVNDFMVAQPWLKGVEQSHVVTNPNTLRLAALSVG